MRMRLKMMSLVHGTAYIHIISSTPAHLQDTIHSPHTGRVCWVSLMSV